MDGYCEDKGARSTAFVPTRLPAVVGRVEMEELVARLSFGDSVARICLHASTESAVHVMVIAQTSGRYWRPKLHQSKDKIFQILEGSMAVITWTASGAVSDVISLERGGDWMVNIPAGTFHTNVATTNLAIHQETIRGPYRADEPDRVYAAFSPDEDDQDAGLTFIASAFEGAHVQGLG